MIEDKKDNSRRKVLKVAAGAGLIAGTGANWESNKWTKPVVETVLLPAHAQTSGVANGTFSGSTSVMVAAFEPMEPSGFDTLVPTAHAQVPISALPGDLCIEIENNQVNARAFINGMGVWEGTGALDTVLNLATGKYVDDPCNLENVMLKVSLKGTEPGRAAFGDLSLDFGCNTDPTLTGYTGAYEIMESATDCPQFMIVGPIVKCICEEKKATQ